MMYICPICGGKLRSEEDVRAHAERHSKHAYRRRPSFAPHSTYVQWFFAYIWLRKRPAEE